ncbi:metalloregulator ArsR/SmtB family transcription factor [Patescibacteria group bacterium]|nr:metalloregulator ArsR/SmtB family transcription factor [Patescibacteria group bacterium]MBU2260118.1 metalloregulator ArsR/SmtB family transcription factor [Patescibacteria group bacterium]
MITIPKLERSFKALANKRRLQILLHLKKHGSSTVYEIARAINLRIQATSQHLKIIKLTGIVTSRKQGLYIYYQLSRRQEKIVRKTLSLL